MAKKVNSSIRRMCAQFSKAFVAEDETVDQAEVGEVGQQSESHIKHQNGGKSDLSDFWLNNGKRRYVLWWISRGGCSSRKSPPPMQSADGCKNDELHVYISIWESMGDFGEMC